ncbi:MAG: hypothetical protein GF364_03330 [Candidatus Lokiarchaeota archaeon]|nr:hypothetical protein [Candidatus Lokiarchaeota archaeon]
MRIKGNWIIKDSKKEQEYIHYIVKIPNDCEIIGLLKEKSYTLHRTPCEIRIEFIDRTNKYRSRLLHYKNEEERDSDFNILANYIMNV